MSASFIFERTIIREKLKSEQPDILVRAGTNHFQLIDIWKVDEILAAAEPAKAELKMKLARVIGSETLEVLETAPPPLLPAAGPQPEERPRLLRRLKTMKRPKKPAG